MPSRNPSFYTTGEKGFIEKIGTFSGYGYGTMLVYYAPYICEYVQFTPWNSIVKNIISRELLDKYKREVTADNNENR